MESNGVKYCCISLSRVLTPLQREDVYKGFRFTPYATRKVLTWAVLVPGIVGYIVCTNLVRTVCRVNQAPDSKSSAEQMGLARQTPRRIPEKNKTSSPVGRCRITLYIG